MKRMCVRCRFWTRENRGTCWGYCDSLEMQTISWGNCETRFVPKVVA